MIVTRHLDKHPSIGVTLCCDCSVTTTFESDGLCLNSFIVKKNNSPQNAIRSNIRHKLEQ